MDRHGAVTTDHEAIAQLRALLKSDQPLDMEQEEALVATYLEGRIADHAAMWQRPTLPQALQRPTVVQAGVVGMNALTILILQHVPSGFDPWVGFAYQLGDTGRALFLAANLMVAVTLLAVYHGLRQLPNAGNSAHESLLRAVRTGMVTAAGLGLLEYLAMSFAHGYQDNSFLVAGVLVVIGSIVPALASIVHAYTPPTMLMALPPNDAPARDASPTARAQLAGRD